MGIGRAGWVLGELDGYWESRTTLRAVGGGWAGRATLGGLGQRYGELIANCD